MPKAAVVLLAGIETHADMGRAANAPTTVQEFVEAGDDVTLVIDGAGMRWAAELLKDDNKLHGAWRKCATTSPAPATTARAPSRCARSSSAARCRCCASTRAIPASAATSQTATRSHVVDGRSARLPGDDAWPRSRPRSNGFAWSTPITFAGVAYPTFRPGVRVRADADRLASRHVGRVAEHR